MDRSRVNPRLASSPAQALEVHVEHRSTGALLNSSLAPDVVCAQFGWWQACEPLQLPGYDVEGPGSANYNSLIDTDVADPISGTISLRSSLCEVRKPSS